MSAGIALPFPLGLPPGGVNSSAAGKLQLIEQKQVAAAVASVTFSGLAGDTEKRYLLFGRIYLANYATINFISVRPNGDRSALTQMFSRQSHSNASAGGGSNLSAAIGQISHAAVQGYPLSFALWIDAARQPAGVASRRGMSGTGYHADNASPSFYCSLIGAVWNNTADEITSLDIAGSTADLVIGAGSEFALYSVDT